jgi:tetratricopeptide (TPR) repeat protein
LLWLESGATLLRAGKSAEAERFLNEGLGRLAADDRPRMSGEESLWYYKRGAARTALGRAVDAEQDLRRALALEGRKWVHGRAHLEMGRLLLQAGKRAAAESELRTAISLCEADGDPLAAAEARRLLP